MMIIHDLSEEQIRARAFELYLEHGGQPGHEVEDWLQAEFEVAHRPFRVAHLQPFRGRRTISSRQRGSLSLHFSNH
jgi:hypothetical protein